MGQSFMININIYMLYLLSPFHCSPRSSHSSTAASSLARRASVFPIAWFLLSFVIPTDISLFSASVTFRVRFSVICCTLFSASCSFLILSDCKRKLMSLFSARGIKKCQNQLKTTICAHEEHAIQYITFTFNIFNTGTASTVGAGASSTSSGRGSGVTRWSGRCQGSWDG